MNSPGNCRAKIYRDRAWTARSFSMFRTFLLEETDDLGTRKKMERPVVEKQMLSPEDNKLSSRGEDARREVYWTETRAERKSQSSFCHSTARQPLVHS